MKNRALVFLNTEGITDEWMNFEIRKANWFIDALMIWGWKRGNITFLSEPHDLNTHAVDGEPTRSSFVNAMNLLGVADDTEYAAVYLCNCMPCWKQEDAGGNLLDNVLHFKGGDEMEPQELRNLISDVQRENGQDHLTVVFCGQGGDRMASEVSSNQYVTMASHDTRFHEGQTKVAMKKDAFNIGGKMPMVQDNEFIQAFMEERNRVMEPPYEQYPVLMLE